MYEYLFNDCHVAVCRIARTPPMHQVGLKDQIESNLGFEHKQVDNDENCNNGGWLPREHR